MARPADALVTGFCHAPRLVEKSFAPLRRLRQEGHLRSIHYVTWDRPEIDACVAPLAAMDDVTVTRVPQPDARGTPGERGVVYQVENLRAGLALLPPDGLVLKLRPDFVAATGLLREKIVRFEQLCAPVSRTAPNGVTMPAPVLAHKIWLAWSDSSQPFFFEDAAFLATRRDAALLLTSLTAEDGGILADGAIMGPYAHVVRYARIFLDRYPLFANYLKNYRWFANDMAYRTRLVPLLLADGFFWHLVVAHAWILYSQFHIDAGGQGDIQFYANNCNRNADWSDIASLKTANPYDSIAAWRDGTRPGEAAHSLWRFYGRLVDDAWATALFTRPLPDLPPPMLRSLMENVAACGDGRLAGIEQNFYRGLERLHQSAWPRTGTG